VVFFKINYFRKKEITISAPLVQDITAMMSKRPLRHHTKSCTHPI
jgi:hypothetical protein